MPTTDDLIHTHARLGLITRPRLLALGVSDEEILGRVHRGSLRLVHAGVYATFGRPLDHRARVLAACLAAGDGAVASHRTALSMWDLLEGEHPVDITTRRQSHPVPGGFVLHRPNLLRPVDVTTKKHIPITNPMRSLLDAGAVLP